MADPSPSVSNEIHSALQDQVTALANKHVTVSYVLMGILVFVLILGGVGAYLASKWVDRAMARAEASEKLTAQYKTQYDALNQIYQKALADDAAQRAADEQKFVLLAQSIKERNQASGQQINNVKNPEKTLAQSLVDFQGQFQSYPTFRMPWVPTTTTDGAMATLTTPQVQEITALKIEYDTCNANSVDMGKQLALKDDEINTLNTDVANSKGTLAALQQTETQCEDTVKQYKKIATLTKWQKIWKGAVKGMEIGGALVLGVVVGRRL